MHPTRPLKVDTGPAQLDPPTGVTAGHVGAKPIAAGVRSPTPLHDLSGPPHERQMVSSFRASALARRLTARPSPGFGQELAWAPRRRASQHFWSTFARVWTYLDAPLLMACWQRLTALDVANWSVAKLAAQVATAWSTERAPMHCKQAEMSVQVVMALVQPVLSKSGQVLTLPQPVAARGRSSPSPQSRLEPPQVRLMSAKSFTHAASSDRIVAGSAAQSSPIRMRPLSLPSSHLARALVRART